MKHTPKNENKKIRAWATVLFFGGLIGLLLSPLGAVVARGYWQLAGMIAWVGCAYLMIRYVLTSYTYQIAPRSPDAEYPLPSEMDFTVYRVQGSRSVPMIKVSLETLVDLIYVGDRDYRALPEFADYRGARVYDYTVNASRENRYMVVFRSRDEEYHAVLFEPDAKMASYLVDAKKPFVIE